jgi:hypothetical protein
MSVSPTGLIKIGQPERDSRRGGVALIKNCEHGAPRGLHSKIAPCRKIRRLCSTAQAPLGTSLTAMPWASRGLSPVTSAASYRSRLAGKPIRDPSEEIGFCSSGQADVISALVAREGDGSALRGCRGLDEAGGGDKLGSRQLVTQLSFLHKSDGVEFVFASPPREPCVSAL